MTTTTKTLTKADHRFLTVVSMDAESAKAFGMPDAAKVVCVGQADPLKYKFGARVYRLFKTIDDYNAHISEAEAETGGAA